MKKLNQIPIPFALRYMLLGALVLMSLGLASASADVFAYQGSGDTYYLTNGMINYTLDTCSNMFPNSNIKYINSTSGVWSDGFPLFYRAVSTGTSGQCFWNENSTDRAVLNRTNFANHTILITIEKGLPYITFTLMQSNSSNGEQIAISPYDSDFEDNWHIMFFGFNGTYSNMSSDFTYPNVYDTLDNNWVIMWSDVENISFFAWYEHTMTGAKYLSPYNNIGSHLFLPIAANYPDDYLGKNNSYVFGVMEGLPTGIGSTDTDGDGIPDSIDNDTADYSPYYNYYEPYSYVTNCSTDRPIWQEALNLITYDEGSDTSLILTDIETGFTLLYANGTEIRAVGVDSWSLTTHEYCIFPQYGRLLYDAHVQTDTGGYYPRDYFYNNASISYPGLEVTNLYLINETMGDQIAIHVRDENLNDKVGAEVRVLRWLPPSYTTISILYTNSEGKAYLAVDRDEWYKFQVLYDGELYLTTDPTQLLGKDTTSYPYVIDVTFGEELGYFQWISGISYAATWNKVTNIYQFVVVDGTGLMTSGSITADQMNLTGMARVCWNNATSASFTISCDLSAEHNGTYNLNAWFEVGTERFIVDSRTVVKGAPTTQLTNQDGVVMSLIFVGTIAMAGIIHPILMILLTIFGLIAVGILQLSLIGMEYILPIVFVGIILIFIMRRQ